MAVDSINKVVKNSLCISCGACVLGAEPGSIQMQYHPRRGMYLPCILNPKLGDGQGEEFNVCPGKGYSIVGLSRGFDGPGARRDIELGAWRQVRAARTTDRDVLERATSGGVMTLIADYLMTTGRVDGAIVTGIQYTSLGPRPEAYVARTRAELLQAQGSKYCPSPTLLALSQASETKERFVFLGTPCQIAGLRMLQERRPDLRDRVPYVIGSFCGGFRDLRETDTLIRREKFSPSKVTRFRYRGGGQPGSMLIEDHTGRIATLPYPEYVRRTGFVKVRRCRLCVDATAELADFSCGDAWLARFLQTGHPWSIVMTRTDDATRIVEAMGEKKSLVLADISVDEIKQSQCGNLLSKKSRQSARRRLFRLLGLPLPEFDGGFVSSRGGLLLEAKVFVSHAVFACLENLGLYPLLAKLIRRY